MFDTGTQSLKYMALVKIATTLWNQDIRSLSDEFDLPGAYTDRKMEERVIDKLPQLSQPGPLKKEILGFIKPIGLRILTWMRYHQKFLRKVYVKKSLNSLVWTSQGTVDSKKTAEILIKDEKLNITDRYKLACIYCLEDDIPKLWNKIPENRKKSFYREDPLKVNQHHLVLLWTYDMKGEIAKMDRIIERTERSHHSPYQYAFDSAVFDSNKVATEYFLQKLTSGEREESLVRSVKYAASRLGGYLGDYFDFADILYFLLSQLDEEKQREVFMHYPYGVLTCLLDCPSLFMEAANRMWDFLSQKHYNELLKKIIEKVKKGYKDYDYQILFREFWQQSPNGHKRFVLDECASGSLAAPSLVSKLFEIDDEKNIKLILKGANIIENKLILGHGGQYICQHLVYGDRWNLLEFLIRECIPSKNEMIKFKQHVTFWRRVIFWRLEKVLAETKEKWDTFFQLLDDLICGYNKRKSVEGNISRAKKL